MDPLCLSKIASIAEVGESASSRTDFIAMSFQTSAWSDIRCPLAIIENDTFFIRFARPVAYCVRGADLNDRDRVRQRPASTHDTGIVSSELGATRIERLTMRFCLAPRSSS